MRTVLESLAGTCTGLAIVLGFARRYILRPLRELVAFLEELHDLPGTIADLNVSLSRELARLRASIDAIDAKVTDELQPRRRAATAPREGHGTT